MDEQRKQFLEVQTTLDEDSGKIFEMTTKDLEYYTNLGDKAAAQFKKTEKWFVKGKVKQ